MILNFVAERVDLPTNAINLETVTKTKPEITPSSVCAVNNLEDTFAKINIKAKARSGISSYL